MPPIRTPTIKPVKTERTHEENQERAYIAASRRSDRSLEARIESARRASEIHKKRTGRALRVTEQDVVNEEMYEEEDDDLPSQYRRLQSHLQTGSWEFNRRLQAYMATQMGTRNALMEQSNFFGSYPNAPSFANQFGQPQHPTMMNPQMLHLNQGYRQAPYPMPSQGFSALHHRAASISTPQDYANYMQNYPTGAATPQLSNDEQQRRMSLPPQPVQQTDAMRPPMSRTSSSSVGPADGTVSSPQGGAGASPNGQQTPVTAMSSNASGMAYPPNASAASNMTPSAMNNNFAPFSTSLPPETQQLLCPPVSMENANSYNPYWFTGNAQPFSYSYKPNSGSRSNSPGSKPVTSKDPTLALNPLDTSVSGHSPTSQGYMTSAATDGAPTPFSGNFSNYNFGADSFFTDDQNALHPSSGQNSGLATPGGADWTSFLEPFEDAVVSDLNLSPALR